MRRGGEGEGRDERARAHARHPKPTAVIAAAPPPTDASLNCDNPDSIWGSSEPRTHTFILAACVLATAAAAAGPPVQRRIVAAGEEETDRLVSRSSGPRKTIFERRTDGEDSRTVEPSIGSHCCLSSRFKSLSVVFRQRRQRKNAILFGFASLPQVFLHLSHLKISR